jgi:hypothetical protein
MNVARFVGHLAELAEAEGWKMLMLGSGSRSDFLSLNVISYQAPAEVVVAMRNVTVTIRTYKSNLDTFLSFLHDELESACRLVLDLGWPLTTRDWRVDICPCDWHQVEYIKLRSLSFPGHSFFSASRLSLAIAIAQDVSIFFSPLVLPVEELAIDLLVVKTMRELALFIESLMYKVDMLVVGQISAARGVTVTECWEYLDRMCASGHLILRKESRRL